MVFIFNLKIISSAAGHMKMKRPMAYPIHSIYQKNILPSECVQWLALPPFWVALRWHPPSRRPHTRWCHPSVAHFNSSSSRDAGGGGNGRSWLELLFLKFFKASPCVSGMIFLLRMLYPWAMSSADHDRSSSAFGIVVGYKKKLLRDHHRQLAQAWTWKGKNEKPLKLK